MALKTQEPWQLYLASGSGSCAAEIGTIWIDVIKVRMQITARAGGSSSAFGVARGILANEGPAGFAKGLSPALLRASTYGSLRIGMYEPIKEATASVAGLKPGTELPLLSKVFVGAFCGGVAQAICCPTDVVKIRLQADAAGTRYHGITDAFTKIARTEGVRGLYQGVSPASQRAAVVAAVELSTYDSFKTFLLPYLGDSIKTHFGAALMAGFLSTVASSPLDVVKARMMNQKVDAAGVGLDYRGPLDCARKTMAKEGSMALWRGFWPNYARLGPHNVIMWLVVEQVRSAFNNKA